MSSHTFFKTQFSFILSYFIHIHISIRIILSKQPHSHFSHSNTLLFITNIILILSLLQSLHSIPILTTLQVSSLTHSSNLQFLYFNSNRFHHSCEIYYPILQILLTTWSPLILRTSSFLLCHSIIHLTTNQIKPTYQNR